MVREQSSKVREKLAADGLRPGNRTKSLRLLPGIPLIPESSYRDFIARENRDPRLPPAAATGMNHFGVSLGRWRTPRLRLNKLESRRVLFRPVGSGSDGWNDSQVLRDISG